MLKTDLKCPKECFEFWAKENKVIINKKSDLKYFKKKFSFKIEKEETQSRTSRMISVWP